MMMIMIIKITTTIEPPIAARIIGSNASVSALASDAGSSVTLLFYSASSACCSSRAAFSAASRSAASLAILSASYLAASALSAAKTLYTASGSAQSSVATIASREFGKSLESNQISPQLLQVVY